MSMSTYNKYKRTPEDNNPCYKEHSLSLQCLDASGYNRDSCLTFFDNYNNCKAFWNFVYKERKRMGIKPYLPPVEDRPVEKEKYLPFFKGK